MIEVDPAGVEYGLRRLERAELAAFVADLWAARGFDTDRSGGVIEASTDDGTLRILVTEPGAGRWSDPDGESVAVLVAPDGHGQRTDLRVVDASRLAEMVRYAVDRPDAHDLCVRHLGAPPEDLPRPPRHGLGTVPGTARPVVLVGVLAVLLAVGVVAGFGTITDLPGVDRGVASGGTGSGANDTESPPVGTSATPVAAVGDTGSRRNGPPPGVAATGITDIDALAAAHDSTLDGRSHTIWLNRYRPRGLDPNRTRIHVDVDIAAEEGRYLISKSEIVAGNRTRRGAVYREDGVIHSADWNATAGRYHRIHRLDSRNVLAPMPYELRRRLVERYLSTPGTDLEGTVDQGGATLYRVVGQGTPRRSSLGDVKNYSVSALVDRRGVVRQMTVEYRNVLPDRSYRTRIEISYGRIGTTSVERPDWYDRRGSQDPSGANRPL
jgi:hypothetical protein